MTPQPADPRAHWRTLTGDAKARAIDAALATGIISEADWFAEMQAWLEGAYLAAETPFGQSGSSGDGTRWQRKRRVIVEAVDRNGSFLDIGCANGLLMQSMVAWAAVRGITLEPYGLDISPAILALAQARLPQWRDRLFLGNALTWQPPRRFDFVRVELIYVPPRRRRQLVVRLLREVVVPGGRLIVCGYGDASTAATLRDWGYEVAGTADVFYDDGRIWTHVAWVENGFEA